MEFEGDGLDPRYDYVTVLRDPVERVLSWIYFVRDIVDTRATPAARLAVAEFIDSDGRLVSDVITEMVSNYYVRHFQSCLTPDEITDSSLGVAEDVLSQYEMVLFTEELGDSGAKVASFFGLDGATPINYRNSNAITNRDGISNGIRERVATMNQLDIELYTMARRGKITGNRQVCDSKAFMHSTRVTSKAKPHPIPAYWTGASLKKYFASDLVIGAGYAADTSVVGNGDFGYLLSGPFLAAPPGSYVLLVHACLQNKDDGLLIQVTGDAGREIVAEYLPTNESGDNAELFLARQFQVKGEINDLEVKIAAVNTGAMLRKPRRSRRRRPGQDSAGGDDCLDIIIDNRPNPCVPTVFSVSVLDLQMVQAKNDAIVGTIADLCNGATREVVHSTQFGDENTHIGTYTSATIETRGQEGMLLCRDFVSLGRMRSQFFLFGEVGPGGLAGAALMLKRDDGRIVIQTKRLRGFVNRTRSAKHGLIAEPITVDIEESADDLEVCLYVTAQSEFSLRNVTIVKVD